MGAWSHASVCVFACAVSVSHSSPVNQRHRLSYSGTREGVWCKRGEIIYLGIVQAQTHEMFLSGLGGFTRAPYGRAKIPTKDLVAERWMGGKSRSIWALHGSHRGPSSAHLGEPTLGLCGGLGQTRSGPRLVHQMGPTWMRWGMF